MPGTLSGVRPATWATSRPQVVPASLTNRLSVASPARSMNIFFLRGERLAACWSISLRSQRLPAMIMPAVAAFFL